MENLALAALLLLPVAFLLPKVLALGSRDERIPPGPPTRWLVGNAHLFPKSHPHLTFTEWGELERS